MRHGVVHLDPSISSDLDEWARRAATVHVLRARADDLRGPRRGALSLGLALRAAEIETEVLEALGIERGAVVLRDTAQHPATVAAIERWRYARSLAARLAGADDQPN